jgi:hypothetical protein
MMGEAKRRREAADRNFVEPLEGRKHDNYQTTDRLHPMISPARSAALSLLIRAGATLPEIQYLADEIDRLEAGSQRAFINPLGTM